MVRGFEEARHDALLVIDADLSHPPEKIPEVAEKVFSGEAEFTIGSRYVGGGEMRDWPWWRKLNSWVATVPARLLTPVARPDGGLLLPAAGDMAAGGEAERDRVQDRAGADGEVSLPELRGGSDRVHPIGFMVTAS